MTNSFRHIARLLLLVVVLTGALVSQAQPYNNEWISFEKTYFKIKVARDSIYRIPVATLQSVSLQNIPVEQFRLYRNGTEVPMYTTNATGPLAAGGYLEFYGQANDGSADNILYRRPAYQHNNKFSLHSDTAVYFLTVDPVTPGLRYRTMLHDPNTSPLTPEPYFMYSTGHFYREQINNGQAADIDGQYIYSSSYDVGEFWSSYDIRQRQTRTESLSNLFPYAGGPDARLTVGAFGNTAKTRTVRAAVNNSTIIDTAMNYFTDMVSTRSLPSSLLTAGANNFSFTNVQPPAPGGADPYTDRFVLSFYQINYARQFNFGNQSQFAFTLPIRTAGYLLEITNFDAAGTTPVLYDLANGERYVANTETTGVLRFALTGNAVARRLVLVRQGVNAVTVTNMTSRQFTNYGLSQNQGNYLIVSNPKLYGGPGGSNPVEDYRAYRASSAGGAFRPIIANIDELVDQFAFGIKGHPLSIKNFIRYSRDNFPGSISKVLLIGKGVSYPYFKTPLGNEQWLDQPQLDDLDLVPTFGYPGSDNLLTATATITSRALSDIGRLSVVHASEVADYLVKVKEYEAMQANPVHSIENKLWMKNGLQVTGAFDALLGTALCNYIGMYKTLVEDTLIGGKFTNICKFSTGNDPNSGNLAIRRLFEGGLSMFTYFGHSSATTLEFNLEDPEVYNINGKYPVFSVNGCYAGDFFQYSTRRFTELETISEKYTLAKQKGCIAFLASTHYGISNYLHGYLDRFFRRMGHSDYGAPLGQLTRDALGDLLNDDNGFLARTNAEQINLHGDPALFMNFEARPDYVVEQSLVTVNPTIISVAQNTYKVNVKYYNMGRAIRDSINVEVSLTKPNGNSITLYNQKRLAPLYADSLEFEINIDPLVDKGLNNVSVVLDGGSAVTEMEENNNSVVKGYYIYEDEVTPVFPYQYAIVSNPSQKLFASTANPLVNMKQYVMEIDTTALFNSPSKVVTNLSSVGGVLEFTPQISYRDSIVYYWRTANVPTDNAEYVWNQSSFFFRNGVQEGFNQSHFYQQTKSTGDRTLLDSASRRWAFTPVVNDIFVRQGTYPNSSPQQLDYTIAINGGEPTGAGCTYDELIFIVLDRNNFKPWDNPISGGGGRFNSYPSNCGGGRIHNFEFLLSTPQWRKRAMDFIDSIPAGSFVVVKNNGSPDFAGNTYPSAWAADTALYGSGISLYHKLRNAGFLEIDSVNRPRSWAMVFKKGGGDFEAVARISENENDRLIFSVNCETPNVQGAVYSPAFGPAKKWHQLRWTGHSLETASTDSAGVAIYGLDANGNEILIRNIASTDQLEDISDIDAAIYPRLKLHLNVKDTINATPYQLDYWRLIYDPVPEGALAPNIYLSVKDTVALGENVEFAVVFKNVSHVDFDSLKVKVVLTDKSNVPHELTQHLLKPLVKGDTILFRVTIPSSQYAGVNTLFVEFNPDNHQLEQYHFNNYLYKSIYIQSDDTKPVLDVTFDGVHILNGDIVSAKPMIKIKLTDESKFLLLKDTSVLRVRVRYPDNTLREFRIDNDTVRFTPATQSNDNTASIDFTPSFLRVFNEEGDNYELIVSGKDASDNPAGRVDYSINFAVINKPMISNLLNYPNPFTTSTAFVFTLTGSEIPTNFKIQILTVTGKIVREITGAELGPIRIGRNITEFKWDGTDQYGQRLANGVYLYRVITRLNGKGLEQYKSVNDNTDRFFNKGYGKMYLMR